MMETPYARPRKYQWFAVGDINGFFGLMFDNMTVLSFLAGILIFAFGFPADIVYKRMFPGTALGVLFGAHTPYHSDMWKPGRPASSTVGISVAEASRSGAVTA